MIIQCSTCTVVKWKIITVHCSVDQYSEVGLGFCKKWKLDEKERQMIADVHMAWWKGTAVWIRAILYSDPCLKILWWCLCNDNDNDDEVDDDNNDNDDEVDDDEHTTHWKGTAV